MTRAAAQIPRSSHMFALRQKSRDPPGGIRMRPGWAHRRGRESHTVPFRRYLGDSLAMRPVVVGYGGPRGLEIGRMGRARLGKELVMASSLAWPLS